MEKVFISLGGNIGNVRENFEKAIAAIARSIGAVTKESSLYRTAPWGYKDQNDFLNQIICAETSLSPDGILKKLLSIEIGMGRNRDEDNKNAPRAIDLDILFYGDKIIIDDNLIIPHPRLHLRNFVLIPLMEIEPDLTHPVLGKSIKNIFFEKNDDSVVTKL